jgi:hypothetical protein
MQPLSRVKSDALVKWGDPNTMMLRQKLAAMVAQCIAQWAEIEMSLGSFLGLLLHANQNAVLAMYSGVENRAAQLRMITAAAQATVPSEHFDVLSIFLSSIIRPVMKERDRLAHWPWGHSDELPEALLMQEPMAALGGLMRALTYLPGIEGAAVPANFDVVYVIREGDLEAISKRFTEAKELLRMAMASVWDHNTQTERDEYLRRLSNVPPIREGLDRLARDRQKTQ